MGLIWNMIEACRLKMRIRAKVWHGTATGRLQWLPLRLEWLLLEVARIDRRKLSRARPWLG